MKYDLGLMWAKVMNIWSQIGTIIGVVQFMANMIVLYTVTIHPNYHISFWFYLLIILAGFTLAVGFILKVGISGFYRYFNQQSAVAKIKRDTELIKKKLGIEDEEIE